MKKQLKCILTILSAGISLACSRTEVPTHSEHVGSAKSEYTIDHDFGAVLPNIFLKYNFTIRNTTNDDWTIDRIEKQCSCTTGEPSDPCIRAKTETTFEVQYRSPNSYGTDQKAILVHFKEREAPTVKLQIRAFVRDEITVNPQSLQLVVSSGKEQESHFEVYNYSDLKFHSVKVESNLANTVFRTVVIPQSSTEKRPANYDGPKQAWRVTIDARRENAESRTVIEEIRVRLVGTIQGGQDFERVKAIPLTILNRGHIEAEPSLIFFGNIKPRMKASRQVRIRGDKLNELSESDILIRHDLDQDFFLDLRKERESCWLLSVEFAPYRSKNVKGTVNIDFGPKLKTTIKLPVVARVE